jgi:hypothetical protein
VKLDVRRRGAGTRDLGTITPTEIADLAVSGGDAARIEDMSGPALAALVISGKEVELIPLATKINSGFSDNGCETGISETRPGRSGSTG